MYSLQLDCCGGRDIPTPLSQRERHLNGRFSDSTAKNGRSEIHPVAVIFKPRSPAEAASDPIWVIHEPSFACQKLPFVQRELA